MVLRPTISSVSGSFIYKQESTYVFMLNVHDACAYVLSLENGVFIVIKGDHQFLTVCVSKEGDQIIDCDVVHGDL